MRSIAHALQALPVDVLRRSPDLWLAAIVATLIGVLLVPLPAWLLDGLLAANIAAAGLLLSSVLVADRPLAISTFPSVLLLTTLSRLALNVSTTRMILLYGEAGTVVEAFGTFVVRGDLVVGLVVFVVITTVQFLVISKGAERVAEVSARFTLDAMPGKQMSIDAGERAGALTTDQAQAKREELGRESQFYGAMDGAMKFIRGDAVAGLVITALNLVAGMAIGVVRHDLPVDEAAHTFTLLTVGDGLVSQVPALIITLSAGMLTTRVTSHQAKSDLGTALQAELLGAPRALAIAAAFATAIACLPGLPRAPFLAIATVLGIAVVRRRFVVTRVSTKRAGHLETLKAKVGQSVQQAKAQRALADQLVNAVNPVGIDLDPALTLACGFTPGVDDARTELIGTLIPELRDALFHELGVRFPSVRVRTSVHDQSPCTFVIRVKDVPVTEGRIEPDRVMVIERPEVLDQLGLETIRGTHPWYDLPTSLLPTSSAAIVEDLGYAPWTPAGQLALHLGHVFRQHAERFVGIHETTEMLDRLAKTYPSVVQEAVPKVVTVPQLTDVLRRLLDERVSIRDLRSILEALIECSDRAHDSVSRTEAVRAGLGPQIAFAHAGLGKQLPAVLLEPSLEELVQDAIVVQANTRFVAMEPSLQDAFVGQVVRALQPAISAGERPVLLTRMEIRRYVRKLIEIDLPDVAVLSYQELPARLTVMPLGRVSLPDGALAA